ncbi:MAG: MBL fold metallo-hydrolase [Halieaceae bacterium]|jgi:phosphoribosyl 1,2-cyclic phosphodiesterase|nr:MBL fold metallo-hydrolase [Halieaceae bacterium]|tara:strand:+ start:1184 stop:1981 length:798 start_codon:yes stop_codon:yes gene_type:complete
MRIASLGSGSKGNATLVDTGETLVLIDCGLPRKEMELRLASQQVTGSDIDAILVTHEHGDHSRGVSALSRAYDLPVFLTAGTASSRQFASLTRRVLIRPGDRFALGDLQIAAEPVPHDAREPVQYCLQQDHLKLGILTDLGSITPHVLKAFAQCDALVLEFNHDPDMLMRGPYPRSIKTRVGGDFGHLANAQARQFLDCADTTNLKLLFIAHLSQQNNRPELADAMLAGWSDREHCTIIHATQESGFEWVDVDRVTTAPKAAVSG